MIRHGLSDSGEVIMLIGYRAQLNEQETAAFRGMHLTKVLELCRRKFHNKEELEREKVYNRAGMLQIKSILEDTLKPVIDALACDQEHLMTHVLWDWFVLCNRGPTPETVYEVGAAQWGMGAWLRTWHDSMDEKLTHGPLAAKALAAFNIFMTRRLEAMETAYDIVLRASTWEVGLQVLKDCATIEMENAAEGLARDSIGSLHDLLRSLGFEVMQVEGIGTDVNLEIKKQEKPNGKLN